MLTNSNLDIVDRGKKIILISLAIQCLTLFLFLFVTWNVHRKPQYLLTDKEDGSKLMWGLYYTTMCLFVRSIFRAVEYASGRGSYLLTHEW